MKIIKTILLFIAIVISVMVLVLAGCSKATGTQDENMNSSQVTIETTEPVSQTIITQPSVTIAPETKTPETAPPVTIGPGENYQPVINHQDFSTKIDNKYFPLIPGTTFIYDGNSEDGQEHVETVVTGETREILGVNCVVVQDIVWLDGQVIEQTLDWYAQDKQGNVWYFGEESKEYENGEVISTAGSWEAGIDGAKPGIIMEADPRVGTLTGQEYLPGEAEDAADVLSLSEDLSVKYGDFNNCLKTRDYTPLEPGVFENKYYASGVGEILEVLEENPEIKTELTGIKKEAPKSIDTISEIINDTAPVNTVPETTLTPETIPPATLPSGQPQPAGHIVTSQPCTDCHS